MNIKLKNAINIMMSLLGLFILINVLYFIQAIDSLFNVMQNYTFFYIYSIAITIVISGFGINIGVLLLNKTVELMFVFVSFIYSCIFFILQVTITVIPSASACKCTTLSEAILNVQDWSRGELALGLLVFNVIVWLFCRKLKNPDAPPTA